MKNLLTNRIGALMTILILAVGSVTITGISNVVRADQNGKQCVFFSCGNVNITGGTVTSGGGGGGGGQPTPTTATLIVTKAVKGCAAGEACPPPESFTIKITGTNPSPSTVNDDGSGTKVTIDPGEFAVAEAPTAGFQISFSGDCDGKISAGDTKNCTVINTKTQPATGTLTVLKKVICNAGTANCPSAGDFELQVTGTNPSPDTPFPGSGPPGTQVTLGAGDFQVGETKAPAGFTFIVSFSGDCDAQGKGTIAAGDTKNCTVTNTEKATATGKLTVFKEVDNTACPAVGSTDCPKSPSDFQITVFDQSLTVIAQFPGDAMGKDLTLEPGTYTISETTLTGYDVTFNGACTQVAGKTEATVTIAGGDTLTCKVVNTFQEG